MSLTISKIVNIWWFPWFRIITRSNRHSNGLKSSSQLIIKSCLKTSGRQSIISKKFNPIFQKITREYQLFSISDLNYVIFIGEIENSNFFRGSGFTGQISIRKLCGVDAAEALRQGVLLMLYTPQVEHYNIVGDLFMEQWGQCTDLFRWSEQFIKVI